MNKYLKIFSGAAMGVMLSTSAFAAADYAVVLKTLSNPFWVDMKKVLKMRLKRWESASIFCLAFGRDFQSQLQLFEDLSNKNYKGIAFAPLIGQPGDARGKSRKKGIYLVNLDEKIDMDNLKKAGGNVEGFVTTDNVAVGQKAPILLSRNWELRAATLPSSRVKRGTRRAKPVVTVRRRHSKKATQIKLVASQPADWDRIKALDVATNVLQRNPNLKAFTARMTPWQWALPGRSQRREKPNGSGGRH